MDNRADVRQFLATRRAAITPEQAGLSLYGRNRRVTGLRREEVALLAGVSVDYYTRLERGNLAGVSESVLDGLARALRLDEAEREHLHDLARAVNAPVRVRRTRQRVRPSVRHLLDAMADVPAFVVTARLDVVAANRLARALYSWGPDDPEPPRNLARFAFLDSRALDFYVDWDEVANATVATLRTAAGRDPYDRDLSDLVGELSTRSDEFRVRWAAHRVRLHHHGVKDFHHSAVGDLGLAFEVLPLPGDPGLSLTTYSAEPGSPSRDGLTLLATWADVGTTRSS